ncbi:MAG: hypothetical protein Fur005_44470 [Roseiflexaceae bacterium]
MHVIELKSERNIPRMADGMINWLMYGERTQNWADIAFLFDLDWRVSARWGFGAQPPKKFPLLIFKSARIAIAIEQVGEEWYGNA